MPAVSRLYPVWSEVPNSFLPRDECRRLLQRGLGESRLRLTSMKNILDEEEREKVILKKAN